MEVHGEAILGANANGRNKAAGERAFAAVAEQQISAAGSAQIAGENILCAETCQQQLRAIGLAKIETNVFWWRLMARRLHVEPLEGIGFVAREGLVEVLRCVRELGGEFSDK